MCVCVLSSHLSWTSGSFWKNDKIGYIRLISRHSRVLTLLERATSQTQTWLHTYSVNFCFQNGSGRYPAVHFSMTSTINLSILPLSPRVCRPHNVMNERGMFVAQEPTKEEDDPSALPRASTSDKSSLRSKQSGNFTLGKVFLRQEIMVVQ